MRKAAAKHNRWQDHYARRAKKEKFPARSVYKLKEMQQKYNLIKNGDKVLDLGCAPGSWLLYAAKLTGNKGGVVGIDLKPVSAKFPSYVRVYRGNILCMDDDLFKRTGKDFNVVLSDMSPATTGSRHVDSARSFNLCQAALSIAQETLVSGGSFVCKIFHGEDFKTFSDSVKQEFNRHKIFKPQSSRKASKEIYIIGFGKK
ncbi:MAG: RlmE family RNA methyltransferase [Deltaproteobacteria bacterium]|nr:RlmE family RNA methyltransferase [Deltaproteobacteria bacterium]MBW1957742.1 RlmE family RNA methyltransferase [Deltaproteobacteria bacterium]MBW2014218.1 RlmE family RNA methyltransferase [Deltaproteobacteria bacterium]MBW2089478.1 RlmE family RNA methyltransferase [Deltaproteobacteria bacterium]MBW2320374.1 RlmE family RNA methyltransferase [Deltaproteobacteria bacterium]